jgi:hypothetical protein
MNTWMGRSAPLAVVAIALAGFFAACSGGSNDSDGAATAPTEPSVSLPVAPVAEQPGVLRTITDWAGAPDPGGPGDGDGIGSAARFRQPSSVAVGHDGSVWVLEGGAPRIRRIDPEGRVSTVLDGAANPPLVDVGGRHLPFSFPRAMVAAPSGGVFVVLRQYSVLEGGLDGDGPWAVVHVAPGAPARLAVLPAPAERALTAPTALALDRQGRLLIALECGLWRSDGEVLGNASPRGLRMLHASDPDQRGSACGPDTAEHGISRLAIDADDRVLFTLRRGDVQRLEPDLRVSTLGRTSAGTGWHCGSMALDRRGGLLLTGGTSALLRLDASGQEQLVAGSLQEVGAADGPALAARFSSLCGVAVDAQGRTVLADGSTHTLRRITPEGSVSTIAGLAAVQAGYRDGTGKDARFNEHAFIGPGVGAEVVVADRFNETVREVDAQQRVSTRVGRPEDGSHADSDGPVAAARLGFPRHALKTADGSLWIADGNRLRQLGNDNIVRTVATSPESLSPQVLALDGAGDVVAVWATYSLTTGFSPSRWRHQLLRHSARTPAAAPVRLELRVSSDLAKRLDDRPILGLCALPDGSLAFTQADAVLRRSGDGTVEVLAGSPDQPGHADGPAAAARFHWPAGLACDSDGGIYVADYENHTVRYIDAQRNVRTVLGTPGRAAHRIETLPGELHSPRSLVLVPGGLVVASGLGLVRAGF